MAEGEGERERKINLVNQDISHFVKEQGGHYLVHEQIKPNYNYLFRWDGVHLTDRGNDTFIQNLVVPLRSYLSSQVMF